MTAISVAVGIRNLMVKSKQRGDVIKLYLLKLVDQQKTSLIELAARTSKVNHRCCVHQNSFINVHLGYLHGQF